MSEDKKTEKTYGERVKRLERAVVELGDVLAALTHNQPELAHIAFHESGSLLALAEEMLTPEEAELLEKMRLEVAAVLPEVN